MPLEALYSLMDELLRDPDELNILNGILGAKNLVLVTKDFFQSKPQGIDGSTISDDILAFCTLVLSYAKAASIGLKPNQSPKLYISYMPRTEFNTLFKQVEAKLPGDKLFDVFNVLACYNNKGGTVELDETYCEGSLDKPEPIGTKFGDLTYKNNEASVNIKDWITGVGKKEGDKDKLSVFDESIDKSIGGFGTSLEKTYKTDRSVPMFEFRDLLDKQTQEIEKFMGDVDTAIQDLHKKFANPPTKRKRDDACAPQPAPSATSAAPPQDTVKPADPPSQPSCVPNPTKPVKDAHENEQKKVTKFFCDKYAKNTNAQAPVSVVQTVMAGTKVEFRGVIDIAFDYPAKEGNQDDVYDITIKSVDKCTPAHGNNLAAPVPGSTCEDILNNAWKNCNNQGRGGDITADCLVYSIHTKF
ncbi:MAG: hypothetical protein LQ351_008134 [Letrouitia transgressa]|nr:MAG: hypothetical protein LQ351_008134 [Letrouitia transgressa]